MRMTLNRIKFHDIWNVFGTNSIRIRCLESWHYFKHDLIPIDEDKFVAKQYGGKNVRQQLLVDECIYEPF